jgi:GDP-L-fucose synthase
MNFFVTGGNGFLGKFLINYLLTKNHNVVSPSSQECNLLYPIKKKYSNIKFDFIVHLAAWTQAGDFCIYHPGEQWLHNQKINTHILDWWISYQDQAKFISMGTSCSYDPNMPLIEENYLEGKPIDSLYTYAMSKRMLQVGVQSLSKQYNLNYLSFVPSTIYGPDYHQDGRQMHFIFDLIRKILNGKYRFETVNLWGDGNQRRELIYVDDFVETMYGLVFSENNNIINIGAGSDFSIKQFANKICNQVNYDFDKIFFDTTKYVGAKSKVLNIEKLVNLKPNYNPIDIDKGLEKTIHWFESAFYKKYV